MRKFVVLILQLFLFQAVPAKENQPPAVRIEKAVDPIVVDGNLNEASWKAAAVAGSFVQNFPFDSSLAHMQTEAKVTFDDTFLYISAMCQQPKNYIVQSLKRDYPNGSSDIFFVTIDPFRDQLNGFYFAVSPYNIQKEALISNGNELNIAWDNKWYSAVKNYDTYWTVEIAIPFKTLRYKIKEGDNRWNINFCRNNLLLNERSGWSAVPRNFSLLHLGFSGELQWAQVPPPPGTNIALIPYTSGNVSKDFLNRLPAEKGVQAGGDAKIGITPSLNLDVTVNPDFAQVEVDQQITNLSRFELFFPERRQFFVENSDLFGSFGLGSVNPFFSRRIGLSRSPSTGGTVKVPIVAGVRLSGRLNKDWRIGLMNMQTGKEEQLGLPASNFTVAAVQRRVFRRSSIGAILVNKNDFYPTRDTSVFNRVLGLDYNLASEDGKWIGKFFYHRSFSPQGAQGQYASAASISYNTTRVLVENTLAAVGENYRAETGYVPRTGLVRNAGNIAFVFFRKVGWQSLSTTFVLAPTGIFIMEERAAG